MSQTVLITHPNVPQPAIDLLKRQVIIVEEEDPTKNDILDKVAGVDAIFWSSKYNVDVEVIEKAGKTKFNLYCLSGGEEKMDRFLGPQLKCVAVMSAGYDYVDVDELTKRNIKLGHAPKVFITAAVEVAIYLALGVAKRANEARRIIQSGRWSFGPQWMLGQELRGSTIGIVGLGGIGQELAEYLHAFKVKKIYYTSHREKLESKKCHAEFVSFNHLITQSDYIFPCIPLTDETRGMFNKSVFDRMKKTAIFINVSRGAIVEQADLVEALTNRTIFGAGLDVMTPEPLPKGHALLQLDNVVLLPHLGSATYRSRFDTALLTAQNVLAGLKGDEMPAPVN